MATWQMFNRVPNAEKIAASLKDIPCNWSLTPLREKQPLRKDWQTEAFIPHQQIAELLLNGEEAISKKGKRYRRFWSGFGLRLGEASGGLLAIDVDGASAQPILEAMSGGNVPTTVSWTSGKAGRYQLAFQIPQNLRGKLKNFIRSVITKWGDLETLKDESGKPLELLEFRYNRSQSALPPSLHPSTGSYHWLNSPANTEVALAPDWLCEILLQLADKERQTEEAKLQARRQREKVVKESEEKRKALGIVGSVNLIDCFAQSVARLSPEEIFNWAGHSFKQRGREWFGCCPQHQSQSGESFTVKPDSLDWYCYGCNVGGGVGEYRHFVKGGKGTPRGKDFYKITKELATQSGIELPKLQAKDTSSRITNQDLHLLQSTTFDILNPPLVALSPIQSLRDGISKILPIPESVASLTTEAKAPRKERKWFETVFKRIKKAFLRNAKKDKLPRLGFKCFKEDNPDFEEKIRQVQRKLRSLSYDADIELCQRYLPNELANQLPKSGLIGIKAPKGGGKSVLLKKIIAIAKKQGIPILSITPRIALGREQAIKWEITWIDDYGTMQTRAGETAQQIEEVAKKRSEARGVLIELESIQHQQLNLLDGTEALKLEQQKADLKIEIERYGEEIENINAASIKTLALCWDSLWRTKDRDFKESLIIIDEAELGFKHFITGSTCKRNRPYLLQTFKDKLSECLMSGGRVILSDADLTDLPINYVREILPIPIKPFIVTNEYIGEETRWIVNFRTGSRGDTLREIVDAIKDGVYLAITTDSQAEAQALEKLILQDFPDEFCAFLDADGNITNEAQARKKALIVRIDRTTTESEDGKKFIQKPNQQILHWKPRILIYTPSMGVGVSIDESTQRWDADWEEMVPYFDGVYGLFFGVIESSQCRQQLSRVRANVPRIVYAKESNKALEACASFFPDEVKRQTLKYNHSALNILDIAKGIAGYEADDEQIREAMLQVLTESWDKNSRCWKEPSIDLASAFKARENYGLWNLANLLKEELHDEGHTIISLKGFKTYLVEEMADIKDELKAEEATLIAQAPTIPLEEAKKVINTLGATKEQKLSAQKTLLQEELPEVNLTPEFVKKAVVDDRRRWLSQHKLFWYLTNTEAVKQIDTEHWLSNLKKFAESTPFMRDIRSYSPKVKALKVSGVFDFIQVEGEGIADRIYQGDTPEAELFLKRCLKNKDLLQTTLNVLVTKKSSPIGLANRILGKVGLELRKVTKNKSDKRWQLSLELVNNSDRLAVLKAFELRWQISQEAAQKNEAQKQAQTHTEKAAQPQGQSPVYIDTDQGCPYPCAVESQGGYEPLAVVPIIPAETLSPVEEVVSMLPYCQSAEDLSAIAAGYSPEVIEDAIALQDSHPRRYELTEWLEMLGDSAAIEGYSREAVEDAIAVQPTQPRWKELEAWLEELSQAKKGGGKKLAQSSAIGSSSESLASRQEPPALTEGSRVRIKERLLGDRPSLMHSVEGIIKAVSALGRLTIEHLGRIEYFDESEVEVLASG